MTPRQIISTFVEYGRLATADSVANGILARLKVEGFVIVPIEATEDMLNAMSSENTEHYGNHGHTGSDDEKAMWEAAIEASQ
jgi:hypothetical protein